MSDRQRSVRVGTAVILAAIALRLMSTSLPQRLYTALLKLNTAPVAAIYLETGRNVRFLASSEGFSPDFAPESAAPLFFDKPDYSFDPLPKLNNTAAVEADLQALLEKPLTWDLENAAVLILSTHTTESYTKGSEDYKESAGWRTLDENYNMLSIGDIIERRLAAAGIRVIRDRELHDYPSYNGSYAHAREAMKEILEKHPQILLVLDLHRDAADGPNGSQLRTLAGEGCAQLMTVLGSGFENWQENLSLALKLSAQLERQRPGITRPIQLRRATFNQDLCPGALLIEVGAAGNSHPEAIAAAEELAEAIIALSKGTVSEQSVVGEAF